jgi:hypothetical protein
MRDQAISDLAIGQSKILAEKIFARQSATESIAERVAHLDRARVASEHIFERQSATERIVERVANLQRSRATSDHIFERQSTAERIAERVANLRRARITSERIFERQSATERIAERVANLQRSRITSEYMFERQSAAERIAERIANMQRSRVASEQIFKRQSAVERLAERVTNLQRARDASEQIFRRQSAVERVADRVASLHRARIASEQIFERQSAADRTAIFAQRSSSIGIRSMPQMLEKLAASHRLLDDFQYSPSNPTSHFVHQLLGNQEKLIAKASSIAERVSSSFTSSEFQESSQESSFTDAIEPELAAIADSISGAAVGEDIGVLLDRFDDIVTRLNRIEHPGVRSFLLNHFWALAGNLIAGIIGFYIALCLPNPQTAASTVATPSSVSVRQIRKNLEHDAEILNELNEYRIVNRKQLFVRNGRHRSARRMSTLEVGDLVHAIEKRREWIRIEWREENGEYGSGWVKSKNLVTIGRINGVTADKRK